MYFPIAGSLFRSEPPPPEPLGRSSVNDHPTIERIVDRALGRGDSSAEIATHLSGCAACREIEEWAVALAAAVSQGAPTTAPEGLVERALTIPSEAPRRARARREWSIARLVEGAFARPLLAGVRGAGTGRRALYEVPGGHIDLEIAPDPEDGERVRVTAQVLFDEGGAPADLMAILSRERAPVSRALGDETGTFVFRRVSPGSYGIEIVSPSAGRALRIGDVSVEIEAP
jgi:hypothetical protein